MSIYQELSYTNQIDSIKGIRFCILSPDEIRRMSVVEVTKSETFNGNEPVANGLYDGRMGVLEHNKICQTCLQSNTFCPGHFGHINLAKPVFHIQFFDIVKKLLKCVCFRCSKLLVDPDGDAAKAILNKKYSRQKRWEMMYKTCSKVRKCGSDNPEGCGAKQPDKITRGQLLRILMEWKDLDVANDNIKKQLLSAEEVLRILKRISIKDAEALGFSRKYNRPEWMICTALPVPPPAVRPSVRTETGQRSEDDLTHKLFDIVKANNDLQKKIARGVAKEQIDLNTDTLQYHVITLIDNNVPGINPSTQRTGRLFKSLTERLKAKEGRIRGNLMGKRVDFSARSVITPDPKIGIDELGVPVKIAMNLTFPEIVNKHNMERLLQFVKNGPDHYPGAKHVRKVKEGNRTIRLKNIDRTNIVLEEGDIVERHIMDGDYVLFNRQPSLHRMSMMCHKIKVMPYNTFRLNVCVCPAFNADFDGDEMNMHVPQSVVSMIEISELAGVPTQIISPRECSPILSIEQDVALGVYRMTKKHVMVSEKQLFNMLCGNTNFIGQVPRPVFEKGAVKKWSGRQLLSTIIPKNVNISMPNSSYDKDEVDINDDNYVRIENGEIIGGTIDKTIYQKGTFGLVHSIFNEYDPNEAKKFFDNTQTLVCDWLVQSGFSVGISDLIVDDSANHAMKSAIEKMKEGVYDIIANIHANKFENTSIKNNRDYFEDKVQGILSKATDEAAKIGMSKINDIENRMLNMIKSKSKGKITNVGQMIACLGQNSDEGKRIPYGFDNRTLPHFNKYDDGPESRGFVENSFVSGLSPHEFFFHAIGGRGGLIDTAVKTSDVGYLQRKLVKAMEDCKVNHDYTVRNASGSIIQFVYGEDGMDPTKIEDQPLPFTKMDYSKLKKAYLLTEEDNLKYILEDDVIENFHSTKDWQKKFETHFQEIMTDREFVMKNILVKEGGNKIKYPIAFARITTNAKAMFNKYDNGALSDLDPIYALNTINKLCDELYVHEFNKANKFLKMLVRCYLSPKKCIFDYKFSRVAFDYVINQVKKRYYDSLAHPSDMVGVVAAQSLGEPCTQLTLNTFHLSGVASASKAVRGVPRIKELMSVTKNIKTPSMSIRLKEQFAQDDKKSTEVLNNIQTTYFKDLVQSTKVYYDPEDFETTIEEDRLFVETYKELTNEGLLQKTKLYPWLLRFELDRSAMVEHAVTMLDIYRVLNDYYEDMVHVMFSDDNSKNLIFRIKIEDQGEDKDIITEMKALERSMLDNVIIKGLPKISKVVKNQVPVAKYVPSTLSIESEQQWVLETAGTNMLDVMSMKEVDTTKTISNDIVEIYELLGVEAARQALYNELQSVIGDAGLYVNYRHIALLVDTMTNKGYLLSIDRHGINRTDIGPFAKCSFEETTDMLIKAGIFAEVDKINGVSANTMLGQVPPAGTGDTDVLIDEWKLQDVTAEQEATQQDILQAYEVQQELEEEANLDFDFEMPL